MQHANHIRGSAVIRRFAVSAAVAAVAAGAILGTAAMSSAPAPAARPAAIHATATPAAPAAAAPAARPAGTRSAARPDAALARAFRQYFRHQAATGMTAWLRTGIEARNQAILVQARLDGFPHRDGALPADSAALAASARDGLAHPAPRDTAGWNTLMHHELTLARELPIPAQGNLATDMDPVIQHDYLAFATATS
jgi:hypothetical protein